MIFCSHVCVQLGEAKNHLTSSQNTLQHSLNSCISLLVLLVVLSHLPRFLLVKSGNGTSFCTFILLIAKFIQPYHPMFLAALLLDFCIIKLQMLILFTDTFKGVDTEAIRLNAIIFRDVSRIFITGFPSVRNYRRVEIVLL